MSKTLKSQGLSVGFIYYKGGIAVDSEQVVTLIDVIVEVIESFGKFRKVIICI